MLKIRSLRGVLIPALTISLFCAVSAHPQDKPATVKPMIDVSGLDKNSYPAFGKWLDVSASTPVDYITKKCREHQLVIIGEQHYIYDYCELFIQAVPEVYKQAGVRVIALEVLNAEDNENLARLVEGNTYDKDLALQIARSQDWGLWGYKEYWDILEAVWKLNRSLPKGAEHMRIVGMDKEMDFQLDELMRTNKLKDPALIEKAKALPDIMKRDEWMTANLEKEVFDKGVKGLALVGLHHAFTDYGQPRIDEKTKAFVREGVRMGNRLRSKYGEKVFEIALHGPHPSPNIVDNSYRGEEPVFDKVIEAIMAVHGNEPVGFDVVKSPFAPLRDLRSYYFHWQPAVTFAHICPGFIYLKPFNSLTRCSWVDNYISDEMFKKSRDYYESAYGRKFKDSREINEFFKAGTGKL